MTDITDPACRACQHHAELINLRARVEAQRSELARLSKLSNGLQEHIDELKPVLRQLRADLATARLTTGAGSEPDRSRIGARAMTIPKNQDELVDVMARALARVEPAFRWSIAAGSAKEAYRSWSWTILADIEAAGCAVVPDRIREIADLVDRSRIGAGEKPGRNPGENRGENDDVAAAIAALPGETR